MTRASGETASTLTHRDDIQGLRAVAVLLVVFGHAGVGFLQGGFVGVDVFFVLSGFLITGLLLSGARKHGRVSLRDFYARRAKRILPAAALTLIVADFAAYHLLNVVRAKQALIDSVWAAFFAANVQFAHQGVDYFAQGQPPSPVQHYWSLAVEEQFYLVWPLLLAVALFGVLAFRRRRRRTDPADDSAQEPRVRLLLFVILLVGLGSLAWSIYHTGRAPVPAYFSTLARGWELALGAALAIGAASFRRLTDRGRAMLGWIGLLAIAAAAVLFSETTPFPGYAALLPTVGTAMVIAAGIGNERSRRGAGRILGTGPMRYVGDRSYGFYLWHWPVLIIAAGYVGHELSLGINLLLMAGAFALSIISYAAIENPIRRGVVTRPIRASAVLWGTSVGLVVVVAAFSLRSINGGSAPLTALSLGALPALSDGAQGPGSSGVEPASADSTPSASDAIPAVMAAVNAVRQGAPLPSRLTPPADQLLSDKYEFPSDDCFAQNGMSASPKICPFYQKAGNRTMVVFGDSHARMWMPAILWMAQREGWTVVPLVELGCGPAQLAGCRSFIDWSVRQLQVLHPDVVLIGGHLRLYKPEVMEASVAGIGTLVDAMKPYAGKVIVVGDPPGQARQPVDCLLSPHASMSWCTKSLTPDQVSLYDRAAASVRTHGGTWIDTMGWFCFEQQCPMVIDGTIAYRDTDHITRSYTLELRELFRDAFTAAVAG